jgi:hypothetical protein
LRSRSIIYAALLQPVAAFAGALRDLGVGQGDRAVIHMPLRDRALELADHEPSSCVVLPRPQAVSSLAEGRDQDWATVMHAGRAGPAPFLWRVGRAPGGADRFWSRRSGGSIDPSLSRDLPRLRRAWPVPA